MWLTRTYLVQHSRDDVRAAGGGAHELAGAAAHLRGSGGAGGEGGKGGVGGGGEAGEGVGLGERRRQPEEELWCGYLPPHGFALLLRYQR